MYYSTINVEQNTHLPIVNVHLHWLRALVRRFEYLVSPGFDGRGPQEPESADGRLRVGDPREADVLLSPRGLPQVTGDLAEAGELHRGLSAAEDAAAHDAPHWGEERTN